MDILYIDHITTQYLFLHFYYTSGQASWPQTFMLGTITYMLKWKAHEIVSG